jgi:hypothetical protein
MSAGKYTRLLRLWKAENSFASAGSRGRAPRRISRDRSCADSRAGRRAGVAVARRRGEICAGAHAGAPSHERPFGSPRRATTGFRESAPRCSTRRSRNSSTGRRTHPRTARPKRLPRLFIRRDTSGPRRGMTLRGPSTRPGDGSPGTRQQGRGKGHRRRPGSVAAVYEPTQGATRVSPACFERAGASSTPASRRRAAGPHQGGPVLILT